MNPEKKYIRHGFGSVRPYIYGHLDLLPFVQQVFIEGFPDLRMTFPKFRNSLGQSFGHALHLLEMPAAAIQQLPNLSAQL